MRRHAPGRGCSGSPATCCCVVRAPARAGGGGARAARHAGRRRRAAPEETWLDGLDEALDELPESQREAIRLRVVDDLSYDEVADRLGTTPAAARVRVHRGLSALRTGWGRRPPDDHPPRRDRRRAGARRRTPTSPPRRRRRAAAAGSRPAPPRSRRSSRAPRSPPACSPPRTSSARCPPARASSSAPSRTATIVKDGVEYHCTIQGSFKAEVADLKGTVEPTVDATKHVNGGCRSLRSDGREWQCYIGQDGRRPADHRPGLPRRVRPEPGRRLARAPRSQIRGTSEVRAAMKILLSVSLLAGGTVAGGLAAMLAVLVAGMLVVDALLGRVTTAESAYLHASRARRRADLVARMRRREPARLAYLATDTGWAASAHRRRLWAAADPRRLDRRDRRAGQGRRVRRRAAPAVIHAWPLDASVRRVPARGRAPADRGLPRGGAPLTPCATAITVRPSPAPPARSRSTPTWWSSA